jgi:NADPH-dependent 2,4-dienoyl-CoA reductase/sulfur reductase-like enzyme
MKDVYAAGDVAEVHNPRGGAATLDVLWSTALAQGHVAGANMAGERRAYARAIAFNVTQLAGLKVTVIGTVGGGKNDDLVALTRGESESWRTPPGACVLSDTNDGNRIRLLIGERTIVGAVVMGDQTWSRPLQRLIVAGADITPIRRSLHGMATTALEKLSDFCRQWQATQLR